MSDHDYISAGFDPFLSRSIDNLSQVNLDSQGPVSKQVSYDRMQVNGLLGDTFRAGGTSFTKKGIIANDG